MSAFQITHLGASPVPDDGEGDAGWSSETPGAPRLGAPSSVDPVVEVSDLLASYDELSADPLVFLGTADSSCDA